MGFAPNAPLEFTNDKIFTNSLSNVPVGGLWGIFRVKNVALSTQVKDNQ